MNFEAVFAINADCYGANLFFREAWKFPLASTLRQHICSVSYTFVHAVCPVRIFINTDDAPRVTETIT